MDHKTSGDPRYFKPEDFGCPPDGEHTPGFRRALEQKAAIDDRNDREQIRILERLPLSDPLVRGHLSMRRRNRERNRPLRLRYVLHQHAVRKQGVVRASKSVSQRRRRRGPRATVGRRARRTTSASRDGPGEPPDECDPPPPDYRGARLVAALRVGAVTYLRDRRTALLIGREEFGQ
jgi:hypothetical protein